MPVIGRQEDQEFKVNIDYRESLKIDQMLSQITNKQTTPSVYTRTVNCSEQDCQVH